MRGSHVSIATSVTTDCSRTAGGPRIRLWTMICTARSIGEPPWQAPPPWTRNCSIRLVNVAINAYKMARVVTYDGQAADDVYPSKGIVAGDSLIDMVINLFYLEAFDQFTKDHPDVGLEVFFDDIQVQQGATWTTD